MRYLPSADQNKYKKYSASNTELFYLLQASGDYFMETIPLNLRWIKLVESLQREKQGENKQDCHQHNQEQRSDKRPSLLVPHVFLQIENL